MTVTPLHPADIIIFGGKGDLALRKILPALYYRHYERQFTQGRIIAVGRKDITQEEYRECVKRACKSCVDIMDTEFLWDAFSERLDYVCIEAMDTPAYEQLVGLLSKESYEERIFYLATPSNVFVPICQSLKESGLITKASRVVLEKPLGHDAGSFCQINKAVLECFEEQQIYRIDHYLGKETVQNLMIIRFANNVFERVWNSDAIDHVQITVAESIGVEHRENYFENAGILRDMVQNHLLQLLCLITMEPPNHVDPHSVRDEKVKVLRSLRPIIDKQVLYNTVRGQYTNGSVAGENVQSYKEDVHNLSSDTETFVAIRAHIDNWRWSGVPFYLRTGKRLPERYSEVVLQFKPVPHHIFLGQESDPESNKLIIRIQPDERITLQMISKVPGPGGYRLRPVNLDLSLAETFEERFPDAYERLLMDVVRGNPTLFMRCDEVETAWRWIDNIIKGWEKCASPIELYEAGSSGPKEHVNLIEKDGFTWHC